MNEQRTLPNEFDLVFCVAIDGCAHAVQMPDGWQHFMDGNCLDDNGFRGHEELPPGLYRAHAKIAWSKDWETGICDDVVVNLSDIEPIWTIRGEVVGPLRKGTSGRLSAYASRREVTAMPETAVVLYNDQEHGERRVTREEWERFLAALPEEARQAMRPEEPPEPDLKLWAVVEEIRSHMSDFARRCQSRPALPHERPYRGHMRLLTRKGMAKYDAHLWAIATAFEQAFGLRPWARNAPDPLEGPLDPLIYD